MGQQDDRRQSRRLERHFVVAYRIKDSNDTYELSQLKNISQGGLRFITPKQYEIGAILTVELRTVVGPDKITLTAEVLASDPVKNVYHQVKEAALIFDTRVAFRDVDADTEKVLYEIVQYFGSQQTKQE